MVLFLVVVALILSSISVSNGAAIRTNSGDVSIEVAVPRGLTRKEYFRSIIDFWTPERMASARPMEPPIIQNDRIPFVDNRNGDENAIERILTRSAPLSSKGVGDPTAAGKAFFVMKNLTYVCSGSVVNANNRDTIVTAGHCVYDNAAHEWVTNWIFVPNYSRDGRPFGTFTSRRLVTTRAWEAKVDYNNDVAIVLVNTNEEEKHVQDLTGAFGISLNAAKADDTNVFGYPVNNDKGETMDTCAAATSTTSVLLNMMLQFKGIQITCEMNGGSSGGPWLRNYNSNTGSGQQVSVTSFGSSLVAGKIQGPLFVEENIGQLFTKYQNE
ncbi:unnamed protein product [Rotaria sp. Silwood1]|nr:unnamed protein product [Rotaria sp. Silwood1]CAF3816424.1 unnamed protein product [Rotaria sp. Silwood1]CAF4739380.1 unnamed protein product [Rotaria sp. Silwood1]CAF4747248.1 unnamed protein product [Rotaria sp. Silwood1]CAF4759199.1 unnamed protein product [Rotaria sp. Silwood1]